MVPAMRRGTGRRTAPTHRTPGPRSRPTTEQTNNRTEAKGGGSRGPEGRGEQDADRRDCEEDTSRRLKLASSREKNRQCTSSRRRGNKQPAKHETTHTNRQTCERTAAKSNEEQTAEQPTTNTRRYHDAPHRGKEKETEYYFIY
jgi:hypothetical protein